MRPYVLRGFDHGIVDFSSGRNSGAVREASLEQEVSKRRRQVATVRGAHRGGCCWGVHGGEPIWQCVLHVVVRCGGGVTHDADDALSQTTVPGTGRLASASTRWISPLASRALAGDIFSPSNILP